MATSINLQHHYNDSNCSRLCNVQGDGNQHHPAHRNDENSIGRRNEMMQQTEDLLASHMNKLSVQERTEALDDVHCVGEELKETPEMMEKALADFAVAVVVLLMKEGQKYPVYEMAIRQNRAYVEDDSFRLKFLRFNFYNVEKSVRQMMRFLEHKAIYFGTDKVARDLTLDDLNEEDMEVLLSGLWHIQEGRDRSGRVILHVFSNMKWKVESLIRAHYILFINILTSDLAVQRKGVLEIFHNVARTGQKVAMPGIDCMMTVNKTYTTFPIRVSTTHFCLHQASATPGAEETSLYYNSFLRTALQILPLYETVRSRIHVGHSVELQYQLRTHGIPLESFPVDMDGKVREDIFYVWFQKYQQAERNALLSSTRVGDSKPESVASLASNEKHQSTTSNITQQDPKAKPPNNKSWPMIARGAAPEPFVMASSATPSENDVLLGRGKFTQSWSGNVKFREFIEKHSDDYDRLSRHERQGRTIELTEALLAMGIRFYMQDGSSGEWVEVDNTEVRKRVSQMFRTIRKVKLNAG